MFVVSPQYRIESALVTLVQTYYKGTGAVVMSSTKKAQVEKENRDHGLRDGLAQAIAEILTVERIKKFPLFTSHEKVNSWDVYRILSEATFFTGAFPDDDEATEIVDSLLALIDGQEGVIAERHEENRRNKILEGELKPEPKDKEWLSKELGQFDSKQAELRKLIMQAENPNVNDSPVGGS
jgi:hypothetical protein